MEWQGQCWGQHARSTQLETTTHEAALLFVVFPDFFFNIKISTPYSGSMSMICECSWRLQYHIPPTTPDFTSVIQLERGTPPSTLISPTCRPLPLPLRLRLSSSVFRLPSSVVRLPLSFPSLPTPVQNYTLYILQFTLIHIIRLSSDLSAVALHSPPVALHYQLSTLHSSLSTLNSPSLLQSPYP